MTTVLISTWIEPDHVARIRSVDSRLRVIYEPDLLPPPRYTADHVGEPLTREPAHEKAWRAFLGEAEVHFDFDRTNLPDLPELASAARWIQGTSAGLGDLLRRHDLSARMPDTVFTTAAGIHARPLAEFVVFALLWFAKRAPKLIVDRQQRRWDRYAGGELTGRTALIVGAGGIGRQTAHSLRALGMRVVGVKRSTAGVSASDLGLDDLRAPDGLADLLPGAHVLVIAVPATPETTGMIGAREIESLPKGAVVVNIGRGAVLDESALIAGLRTGHIGGAALDVFQTEPLPPESLFWEMDNVLLCPHSAATSDHENGRLTDLFCDNLRRYLDGRPLRNVFDRARGY